MSNIRFQEAIKLDHDNLCQGQDYCNSPKRFPSEINCCFNDSDEYLTINDSDEYLTITEFDFLTIVL